MKSKRSYIYILTNKLNTTLYIGVTNDLFRRVYEHKVFKSGSFAFKYNLSKLVYYEIYNDLIEAIAREKRLKKWKRQWKIKLVESMNPGWIDLYDGLL